MLTRATFVLFLAGAWLTNVEAQLRLPPPAPASYPPYDQRLLIGAEWLADPLVTEALAYVESVVPASLLNLRPSRYIQYSDVEYFENPSATCYWPDNQCVRRSNTVVQGPSGPFTILRDIVECDGQGEWGLTYDDGPSSATNPPGDDTTEILDLLTDLDYHATFFVCGVPVGYFPAVLRETYRRGHHIASHTWSHHPLTSLTNAEIVAELKYTESIIYETIGVVVKVFRPPYGDIDDRVRAIASALGYTAVMWTTDPVRDSNDASVTPSDANKQEIVERVKTWNAPGKGFISLEHDINTFTSSIAVEILEWMKEVEGRDGMNVDVRSVAQCVPDLVPYWSPNGGGSSSTTSTTSTTATTRHTSEATDPPLTMPTTTASPTTTPRTSTTTAPGPDLDDEESSAVGQRAFRWLGSWPVFVTGAAMLIGGLAFL